VITGIWFYSVEKISTPFCGMGPLKQLWRYSWWSKGKSAWLCWYRLLHWQ